MPSPHIVASIWRNAAVAQDVPIRVCERQFERSAPAGASSTPHIKEKRMKRLIRTYVRIRERKGQSMAEYALILAAIAVAAYVAYTNLGKGIINEVANVAANL